MAALREIFAQYDVRFDPQRQIQRGNTAVTGLRTRLQALQPFVAGATSAFTRLAAAIGGAAMIAATTRFISSTIRIGDDLDKTSQQLGLTVRQLQAFQHAANLGGVDNAAFAQSLGQLQRNAEAASRGSGEAAEMFRRLGVNVRDENGQLRNGSDLLIAVARGLTNMDNSTERVAISMSLMGRSGRRLLPMMSSIANGTEEVEAELDRLGGGMSELAVRQSVQLTDDIARLRVSFLSLKSAVAVQILPTITRGVRLFTRLSVAIGEIAENSHILESAAIAAGIAVTGATIAIFALSPTTAIVAGVVLGFIALAFAIDDVWTGMEGGKSVTGDIIDALGEMVGVTDASTEAFTRLRNMFHEIWMFAGRAYAAVAGFLGLAVNLDTETFGEQQAALYGQASQARGQIMGGAGRFFGSLPGGGFTRYLSQAFTRRGLGGALGQNVPPELVERVLGPSQAGRAPNAIDAAVQEAAVLAPSERRRQEAERRRLLSEQAYNVLAPASRVALQGPGGGTVSPVNQTVTAPVNVNVVANQATDAPGVLRMVTQGVQDALGGMLRQTAAALLPAGAVTEGAES